jgi:hypothetical protein
MFDPSPCCVDVTYYVASHSLQPPRLIKVMGDTLTGEKNSAEAMISVLIHIVASACCNVQTGSRYFR